MPNETFGGNEKIGRSPLWKLEQKFIQLATPRVPQFWNGHNLTMLSVLWIGLVLIFSWLARENIAWLWGASAAIFLHWLTDSLDGAVGRYRNSGLVHWGFYLDHLFDLVFGSAVFIGYAFLMTNHTSRLWVIIGLAASGVIAANAFLLVSITNRLKLTNFGVGPTEYRVMLIALNTLVIYLGVGFLESIFPYFVGIICIYSLALVIRTQRAVYKLDTEKK